MIVIMNEFDYRKIVDLILKNEINKGIEYLYHKMSIICMPFINSVSRNLPQGADEIIFHNSLLNIANLIKSKKFSYQGEKEFVSFFKTNCRNETLKFVLENYGSRAASKAKHEFIEDIKARTGITIEFEEELTFNYKDYEELVRVFHQLNPECQILLLLKYYTLLHHDEIAKILGFFYQIGSGDVSKTYKSRCIREMRRFWNFN